MRYRAFLLLAVSVVLIKHQSRASEFTAGYEFFPVKELNPKNIAHVESGAVVKNDYLQESLDLPLHLAFVEWGQRWPAWVSRGSISLETGIAATLAPVRKRWNGDPLPGDFTGSFEYPVAGEGFWRSHEFNHPRDNVSR